MKKYLSILCIMFLILFSLVSCKKEEVKEEEPQVIYTIPLGDYQDTVSKRATMTVSFKNKVYCFEINWGSSASENTKWVFSGVYDPSFGGVRYQNEICLNEIYDENGECESTETYTGGKGSMKFENGRLYWDDEQEDKIYDDNWNGIFEKLNYED